MYRSVLAVATLALGGCTIENTFGNELPDWPSNYAPPLVDRTQTDSLLQVTTPKADILWMVDNSCSMSNEQSDLIENFPFFMDYFVGSGLDYHIGVTSSDIISSNYTGSDGTLVVQAGVKYIEPDTPNPIQLFSSMANLGITGRFPERGIGATYLCLEEKRETANAGFYRDEASLTTIAISDEPDFTLDSTITLNEFIDWYGGLKQASADRTFSSIIVPGRGTRYEQASNQIGGIVWDLNQGGWPEVLERLGLQAAGLKREYFLSQLPVPGTIEVGVKFDGNVLAFDEDEEWEYNDTRNSITFVEYVPDALSTVEITYTLLAAEDIQ